MFDRQFLLRFVSIAAMSVLGASCALIDPEARSDSARMAIGAGVPVFSTLETEAVGAQGADAADDPEIWADPRDPSRGAIFRTDKQAGLYVYGLDGVVRSEERRVGK